HDDERLEQVFSVPEEDGPGQVEVQPDPELVVGDILHIGPGHIDRERRARAKDRQRIKGRAVGVDRVIGTQGDLDLEYLTRGNKTRTQQGIRTVAQIKQIVNAGLDIQRVPDDAAVS